jgi:uncharacterized protein YjfI (DUF2170 family)
MLIIKATNNKTKRKRIIEKWEDIVSHLNLDLHRNEIYYVRARQIKEITGQEPRLMAKMDTLESLPFRLRDNDRFLLPVSSLYDIGIPTRSKQHYLRVLFKGRISYSASLNTIFSASSLAPLIPI